MVKKKFVRKKETDLRVKIFREGRLVRVERLPDPRVQFCKSFNSLFPGYSASFAGDLSS